MNEDSWYFSRASIGMRLQDLKVVPVGGFVRLTLVTLVVGSMFVSYTDRVAAVPTGAGGKAAGKTQTAGGAKAAGGARAAGRARAASSDRGPHHGPELKSS